jgi:hypothetical protein
MNSCNYHTTPIANFWQQFIGQSGAKKYKIFEFWLKKFNFSEKSNFFIENKKIPI